MYFYQCIEGYALFRIKFYPLTLGTAKWLLLVINITLILIFVVAGADQKAKALYLLCR